ncbi:unnamed protein product [Haemonchus placei]|uniref:Nuclear receptor domain-containing protein n=1 Tax=Haemonchus placei TaxID=6290 RepID=A0A0N4WWA5_HAEPC|nr:unnamed protein product [Haemonchus placei]
MCTHRSVNSVYAIVWHYALRDIVMIITYGSVRFATLCYSYDVSSSILSELCKYCEDVVKAGRIGADTDAQREQLYRRTHLDDELRNLGGDKISERKRLESSFAARFDSSAEKPVNRKRTNTASSGGGEKRTANKICRVCGDKAFSYNFNVITCESCKAFFRRNANKEREIRCPFNEQCEINVVSRRFCQRCRLAKCFDVSCF